MNKKRWNFSTPSRHLESRRRVACQQGAVSLRAALVPEDRVGDAHLVQVGVAGEHEQAGTLRLQRTCQRRLMGDGVGDDAGLAGGRGIEDRLDQRDRRIGPCPAWRRPGPGDSGVVRRLATTVVGRNDLRHEIRDGVVLQQRAAQPASGSNVPSVPVRPKRISSVDSCRPLRRRVQVAGDAETSLTPAPGLRGRPRLR